MFRLQSLALLAFIIMGLSSCNQQQEEKYIGVQLYSLRDDMKKDVVGTVEKVGEIGYGFVETAGYADGKFYNMQPDSFVALLKNNGMDFISSHTGQNLPDSNTWDSTMLWWDECIEAHAQAGVKYIVQPWMGNVGYESLEGLQAYCDYFNAVGKKCQEKGIKFGYHNHAKEFTELEGEIIYDYMLNNTDPELVTFQLDLYWIYKGGKSPVDYFNQYPGRFELFHVKDETELGASGEIDFQPAFENAEKAGMKYYIVEVERYNFEPLESVRQSFEFLNNAEFVK